ncbi:MAG: RNA polymerase sigma factor [Planctomycetes bacterium]|nr:RNA polymerase sigma factor [Planctomycetota bacterium]MCW8135420.1 RNA polymerase sigma factor [Planctomycetota bacterium]
MDVATQVRPSDEQIIQAHQRDVWRFLVALGCESNEADDLTQETFLSVLRGPFEYRGDAETAAWLRRTAKSLFISTIRKRRRQALAPNLDDADAQWEAYQSQVNEDRRIEMLRTCLHELTERAREALRMRYEHGLSREQMAQKLAMQPVSVRSLLERARAALRECVERRIANVEP